MASKQREYSKRRRESGDPIDYAAYRARRASECEQCGVSFFARVDKLARFCTLACANDFQGRSSTPRRAFKVSRTVRRGIYEAAGWACQICGAPTRPDEHYNHPRYPTLDHIVPRALGGSDEVVNLRLACRQCNVLRGTDVDWSPEVVTSGATGRSKAAV